MAVSCFELLDILASASRVELSAECRKIPPSFEPRKGKGEVTIVKREELSLTLFEKGKWRGVHSREEIGFTNAFRWTIDPDKGSLSLEHLRFGEKNPVYLFDLILVEPHLFKSLKPHECKEDIYTGSVLFDRHYVQLNWQIFGPKKSERISSTYLSISV